LLAEAAGAAEGRLKSFMEKQSLWEILVPVTVNGRKVPRSHHRLWDQEVRKVSRGLTLLSPAKGQWVTPSGNLQVERMIPVRLICTRSQMNRIAALTAQHYQQVAVMFYLLSRQVFIRHYRRTTL
jgi:hypothetical protein